MAFTPKTWADGPSGGTPITAAELNRIEQGIDDADAAATAPVAWADVAGKPAVIAAGADQAAARAAIGAGTSSLGLGTSASTALAGNTPKLSSAAISAIAALTPVSVADATDEASAIALANACKSRINSIIAALKTA